MDSKETQTLIIGVDVGSTNTDSVLYDFQEKKILAVNKHPTTQDIQSGIINTIQGLFDQIKDINKENIKAVMLGTTSFLNAFLQCSPELSKVNVIRLCGPSSLALPPFINWPKNLKNRIRGETFTINGGYEVSGEPINDVNEQEIIQIAEKLMNTYKTEVNIVINGIFSPISPIQEANTKMLLEKTFCDKSRECNITVGHQLAQLGLLEREAAAIMNASLLQMAQSHVKHFEEALVEHGLSHANFYLTQNDGTLISFEEASKFPVLTFSCGPTNSLRGAYQLTQIQDGIVIDIGGTSADFAPLEKGFPRSASAYINVGGVRTNFRMPDTYSIALGGGSIITINEDGSIEVGPKSVGYRLKEESQAFGGQTLTATDIAIATGIASIDGADKSKVKISEKDANRILKIMMNKIDEGIDYVKTQAGDTTVILVGGGSIIVPENWKFEGVNKLIRPQYFGNANALGAAISQISSEIDKTLTIEASKKEEKLEEFKQAVTDQLKRSGCLSNDIEVSHEIIPISYTKDTYRIRVKGIGNLDMIQSSTVQRSKLSEQQQVIYEYDDLSLESKSKSLDDIELENFEIPTEKAYETIDGIQNWIISSSDLNCISLGASVLGSGGGGSPYITSIVCHKLLKDGYKFRVIDPKDLQDDDYVAPVAFLGAPSVFLEKLMSYDSFLRAFDVLKDHFAGKKKIEKVVPIEIGGSNSLIPLITGALKNIPIVDCDGMGRAYPRVEMTSFYINGCSTTPCSCSDDKGNVFLCQSVENNDPRGTEKFLRAVATNYGMYLSCAMNPFSKQEILNYGVQNSLTRCWNIGRAIMKARKSHQKPIELIRETGDEVEEIFKGKMVDVVRDTRDGFNFGSVTIQGIEENKDQQLRIEFQNEFLIAKLKLSEGEKILAIVPDLITIVDKERYQPILCEDLKYGLRVIVIKIASVEIMSNEKALKVIGPQVFGYQV